MGRYSEAADEQVSWMISKSARRKGKLVPAAASAPGQRLFHPAHVIADLKPTAPLAQEEVFGPVLAVIKASNYDHAVDIANSTQFGLTGAVYSKDQPPN